MRISKKALVVLLIVVIFFSDNTFGQIPADSLIKKKVFYKNVVAPTFFIATGLLLKSGDHHLNGAVKADRNEDIPNFHTHADNYLQYAPALAVYGLDILGVKSKNNVGNQTAILIKSEILMTAIVTPLKKFTHVTRPDGSANNSFPSGHTAQAFVAATFLHKEFGQKSIWYSVGAYSCATAVGALRVMNNRHWLSDVLVGAGIGIASTNLVYYTHRYKWTKKANKTVVMPTYGNGPGLYFSYNFK